MGCSSEKKTTLRDPYGFVIQPSYVSLYHTYAPIWKQEEEDRCHAWEAWSQSIGSETDNFENVLDIALEGEQNALRELKMLVQLGIPRKHRHQCWKKFLLQQQSTRDELKESYDSLISKMEEEVHQENCAFAESLGQIDKDLHRTFPSHSITDGPGKERLRRILGAYAIRNPIVGYCQGLNFLAATFLLVFDDEVDAFWCFVAMVEDILTGYFDPMMINQQVDGLVFEQLLKQVIPNISSHFEDVGVHVPTAIAGWFLVAFVNTLPSETMLRVWDILFFEKSPVVIFRVALSLLEIYSKAFFECSEAGDAYMLFQGIGPISFDAKTLVETSTVSFAHVKDSALTVLRDKYAPGVTRVMEKMYHIESNLPSITIGDGALPKKSLSRSGSIKKVPSTKSTGLSTGIEQRLGILRLRAKDDSYDGMDDISDFVAVRRTQSAAFPRSHVLFGPGHNERLQQQLRIDLLSMSTFIPDMALLRTAFEIAAMPNKIERKENIHDTDDTVPSFKSGETMDLSELSIHADCSESKDQSGNNTVLRRFTDGGALLASSTKHNSRPLWTTQPSARDGSGVLSLQTVEHMKNFSDFIEKLENEVSHAVDRLKCVSASNDELEATVQDISDQIQKLQDEIEHKTSVYNALFQRCTELQTQIHSTELEYRRYMTNNSSIAHSWKTIQREIHLNDTKLKMLMDMTGNIQRSGVDHEPASPTKRLKSSITQLINRKFTK